MSDISTEYNNILKLRLSSFFDTKLAVFNVSLEDKQKKNYVLDEDLNNIQITLSCLIDNVSALNDYIYNSIEYLNQENDELEELSITSLFVRYDQVKVDDYDFDPNATKNLASYNLVKDLTGTIKNHNHNDLYPQLSNLYINNETLSPTNTYNIASGIHYHDDLYLQLNHLKVNNVFVTPYNTYNVASYDHNHNNLYPQLNNLKINNETLSPTNIYNIASGNHNHNDLYPQLNHLKVNNETLSPTNTYNIASYDHNHNNLYPQLNNLKINNETLSPTNIYNIASGIHYHNTDDINYLYEYITNIIEDYNISDGSGGLSIGTIFYYPSNIPPNGAKLLNGQILLNCDVNYPDFWNWVNRKDIKKTTNEQYELELQQKGICGKFVILNTNVKLPYLISSFIETANEENVSECLSASLPNIIGSIGDQGTEGEAAVGFPVLTAKTSGSLYLIQKNFRSSAFRGEGQTYGLYFDASRSNKIYDNNTNTVQPKSVCFSLCIQVKKIENIFSENIQLDWDNAIDIKHLTGVVSSIPNDGILTIWGSNLQDSTYHIDVFVFGKTTKNNILTCGSFDEGIGQADSNYIVIGLAKNSNYPTAKFIPVTKNDYFYIRHTGDTTNYAKLIPYKKEKEKIENLVYNHNLDEQAHSILENRIITYVDLKRQFSFLPEDGYRDNLECNVVYGPALCDGWLDFGIINGNNHPVHYYLVADKYSGFNSIYHTAFGADAPGMNSIEGYNNPYPPLHPISENLSGISTVYNLFIPSGWYYTIVIGFYYNDDSMNNIKISRGRFIPYKK